ncbi:DUF5590 domain-containing protein [Sporosarcina sp. FSL K6-1522]|uniref:cell wall elongation regulator TseB-like domain-containing protein n=1 Tax=Sporosarcina sp. FSL K6-1522 TaxID=2921554 RepID=UPI00315A93C0
MWNWIKFIVVFLLTLTSVIIVMVFYNANKPASEAKKVAIQSVIESGQLVTVQSAEPFNGTVPAITVFGLDKDGKEKAVFVNDNSEDGYEEVMLADGITADRAIKTVKQELNVGKVLHARLGMEEENPVWEIAFQSDNGKLNYVYVLFENGQWLKRILNL